MDRTLPTSRRPVLVGLLAVAALSQASCGDKGPKTYPVSGKVVVEKGGGDFKKLVGHSVEFQSATEPNTRAYGEIQADGTFTLSTYREGASKPGAIAGAHKGRIHIEMSDEEGRPRKRGPIDAKYTRFETSGWEINVPTDGEVVLKIK